MKNKTLISLVGTAAVMVFLIMPLRTLAATDFTELTGSQYQEQPYSIQEQNAIKERFTQMQSQIDDLKKANTDLANRLNQTVTTAGQGQFQDERFDNLNNRLRKIESLNLDLFIKTVKKALRIK